jgi:hypothetical protein
MTTFLLYLSNATGAIGQILGLTDDNAGRGEIPDTWAAEISKSKDGMDEALGRTACVNCMFAVSEPGWLGASSGGNE